MTKKSKKKSYYKPLNDLQKEILSFIAKNGPVSQTEISERLRSKKMDYSYVHKMMIPLVEQAYIKVGDIVKSKPGNDTKIYHLTVHGFYCSLYFGNLWDRVDEVFEKWREVLVKYDRILIGKWKSLAKTELREYLIKALRYAVEPSLVEEESLVPSSIALHRENNQAEAYRHSFFSQAFDYPLVVLLSPNMKHNNPKDLGKRELDYYKMWVKVIRGDPELMNWLTERLTKELERSEAFANKIRQLLQFIEGK